jgi:sorbitol-specific phosphotransferase system component IIC
MKQQASPHTAVSSKAARRAFFVYFGISAGVALLFWLVTTLAGDYTAVARYGGTAWIFILTMIVAMPLVIPRINEGHGRS